MSANIRDEFKQIAMKFNPSMKDKDFEIYYDHADDVVHSLATVLNMIGEGVPANWGNVDSMSHLKFVQDILTTFPEFKATMQLKFPGKSDEYITGRLFAVASRNLSADMMVSFYALPLQRDDVCDFLTNIIDDELSDDVLTIDLYYDPAIREFLKECEVPEEQWLDALYEVFGNKPQVETTDYVEYLRKYREELL